MAHQRTRATSGGRAAGVVAPMAQRLLIADDYVDGREALAQLLNAVGGFQVQQAATGSEALQIGEWFRPDVAILDLALSGGSDGFAVAEGLRLPNGERPFLVALTGHGG